MSDKLTQEKKDLEISAGLLVGYLIAGTINMVAFDKPWKAAFSQTELLAGFAGIAISLVIIRRLKRRPKESDRPQNE